MSQATIQTQELRYSYPGSKQEVLKGLSFSLQPGEVFGLLGPSGAGKSTTQKILIGLLKGHQGQAQLLGRNIEQWDKSLYEHIGVSFELPNHFPKLTARENLAYFGSLYQKPPLDIDEVLGWLGLEEAADQRVSGFSKGMKNRLSVARALIHDPQILFLDEPTAGLDPVSTLRVQTLVAKLKGEGKTILINTHNMHIAEQSCDTVAFIHQGEIAQMDHPDQIKLNYGRPLVLVEYQHPEGIKQAQFDLDKLGQNEAFLSLIREFEVRRIHSSEASLDEVFRKVTGAKLAELA